MLGRLSHKGIFEPVMLHRYKELKEEYSSIENRYGFRLGKYFWRNSKSISAEDDEKIRLICQNLEKMIHHSTRHNIPEINDVLYRLHFNINQLRKRTI
jgi:hypothetical protein